MCFTYRKIYPSKWIDNTEISWLLIANRRVKSWNRFPVNKVHRVYTNKIHLTVNVASSASVTQFMRLHNITAP